MAALTFFLAASSSKKLLNKEEIEAFLLDLLREEHLFFPVTIFVGNAQNEPRGEEYDAAQKAGTLLRLMDASRYILPNAPETMLSLARRLSNESSLSPETLWYYEKDVAEFLEAFHRLPFGEQNICFCFPSLSEELDSLGWNQGASLYILTRPFPLDFMDILDIVALPLIDYEVAHYFTLSSNSWGAFQI